MVSLSARLKRTSLPPLSLRTPPSPGARPPHHAQLTAAGSAMPSTNPRPSTAATAEADAEADETTIGDGETLWHGAPVFDAGYWHTKGGSELVQAKHAELHARVEALSIVCSGTEDSWHLECMTLSWPRVQVVDIEYDACQVQPDSLALQWLDMAQDRAWFPQARMYRLTARWAGCTEVFEHPLCGTLGAGLAARLALLDRLPPLTGDRAQEMRFYRYRALFLSSASFAMGTMSKTAAGVRAMNSYITYLFKTDIFAPVAVELIDAQPQHLQSVLAAINANTHNIAYDRMRSTTSTTALQSSLRRICFDMHNMAAGRDRIIFCAAHFPKLESLVVRHSPDFKLPHTDAMNLGSPTPKVESVPGLWPRESFSVHPKHRSLRVLRMPYLQLPFSVALEMLVSIPQLSILEFAPLLRDPTPPSLGIASTLRRRVSITPSPSQPQLNAPFAESSVVYQLGTTKHPLESMILHDACTTRYITTSWIQIMNTFLQLAAVTFVATSQEDVTIASRIKLFCARNDAAFAIETDDQSRTFQTCIDFTNTWSQAEGLISTAGAR
ncbi:hypothetical protein IWW51_003297 [Coemansia sp. RSA 2702]|nr:hypothetical protein IWW51_003297 [Coemansia sp. RSA 2702]